MPACLDPCHCPFYNLLLIAWSNDGFHPEFDLRDAMMDRQKRQQHTVACKLYLLSNLTVFAPSAGLHDG